MADHTITISNALNVMEGGRPTLWGDTGPTTMTWGTDKWGYDSEDMIQDVGKLIAAALASDSAVSTFLEIIQSLSNTLTMGSDVVTEYLTNGIWYTVWPGDVTNAENRITTSYTSSSQSSTYANVSPPSTTWS